MTMQSGWKLSARMPASNPEAAVSIRKSSPSRSCSRRLPRDGILKDAPAPLPRLFALVGLGQLAILILRRKPPFGLRAGRGSLTPDPPTRLETPPAQHGALAGPGLPQRGNLSPPCRSGPD